MKTRILAGAMVLLAVTSLHARQNQKIGVEGGDVDDRGSARLLYWNGQTNAAAGQFAINYGRPVWHKEYDDPAKFDSITKGKVWRMGSNYWSNLYTDVPLTIAGTAVAPGLYFMGLQRSADGSSWNLAFIDPLKVRKERIDAFDIRKAKVEFTTPMSIEPASSEAVEKLTITLTHPENDIHNATLKVAWGHLALTAPVKVTVGD
ncbi:MAG TPA: DUF2911 domain-containing protein [Terriglobia bacterium]|nr:DUF2911 domain-containing protein [Terriglobia bacterium]